MREHCDRHDYNIELVNKYTLEPPASGKSAELHRYVDLTGTTYVSIFVDETEVMKYKAVEIKLMVKRWNNGGFKDW